MQNSAITLLPRWARIVHRLHTLGKLETSYINSLASLTTLGQYPRHVTAASEKSSASLDGSIRWNYLSWHTGIVNPTIKDSPLGRSITFFSRNKNPIHLIQLLDHQQDQCLECILKLFTSKIQKTTPCSPSPQHSSSHVSPESIWALAEKMASPQEPTSQVDLITQGGIISKKIHFNSLLYKNQKIILTDQQNHSLTIDPKNTARIQTTKHTTIIYNQHQLPVLQIKRCA